MHVGPAYQLGLTLIFPYQPAHKLDMQSDDLEAGLIIADHFDNALIHGSQESVSAIKYDNLRPD
jgi:hypothetical protein